MPIAGSVNASRRCASHNGSTSASLFSNAMNSPRAAAMPWLFASQNPRLSGFSIRRTALRPPMNAFTSSQEPSLEPLSTTMISNSTPCSRARLRRQQSRSARRFQFTMTTEIRLLGLC